MGDFLNIIIDDLDDIDGYHFYKNAKWGGQEKIDSFLKEIFDSHGIVNYRACTFDEAKNNPNENYYYFILSLKRLQFVLDAYNGLPLKTDLFYYMAEGNKNVRVVIYNNNETDIADSFFGLNNWIQRTNLNPRLFWFANNNARLQEFKEEVGSGVNVYSSRDLGMKFAKSFKNIPIEFNENKKYLFTSYNGTAKVHRYALLALMMKDAVLDVTDWSLVFGKDYREHYMINNQTEPDYSWFLPIFDVNKIIKYKEEIDVLSKIDTKLTDRESALGRYYDFYDENTFKDSFINIVTESHFVEKDVHITEKTFKPFYFYQIPIFLATKHHVKKLRERYDLDFFDDLVAHDYDNASDDKIRLSMVYNEIYKLYLNRDKIKEFYVNNRHRFEENKRKILEVVAEDTAEFDFFNGMINDKLPNFFFNLMNVDDIKFNDMTYRLHDIKSHISVLGKINFKSSELTDVVNNPHENYFLIFKHGRALEELLSKLDDILPIPENIMEYIRTYKNFKIGFFNDHECDRHDVLTYMDKLAVKNGIDSSQIYVMNNNSRLLEYKELTGSKINAHKLNMLFRGYCIQFSYSKNNVFVPLKNNFFTCHNRRKKEHRYALICAMKKLGLLESADWSLLQNHSYIEHNVNKSENGIDIHFYKFIFDHDELNYYKDELKFLETFDVKKSKYEEGVTIDSEFTFQSILTFEINPYRHSYVNIVTESNYFNEKIDAIHISEKSLIPFFFFQLPIFLASQGHVGKVREYGFDLFDDIIDHSYDDIWDSKDRFNAVVNEIKRLHDNKEAVINFYANNQSRFEKNNQIIVDFGEDTSDRNHFLNLIQQ